MIMTQFKSADIIQLIDKSWHNIVVTLDSSVVVVNDIVRGAAEFIVRVLERKEINQKRVQENMITLKITLVIPVTFFFLYCVEQ